jgi:hypothetical protein
MKKSNWNTSANNWLKKLAKDTPAASVPVDRVFKTYPTTSREDYGYNKGIEIGLERGRIEGADSAYNQLYEQLEKLEMERLARENALKKILAEKDSDKSLSATDQLLKQIEQFENEKSVRENELNKILAEKNTGQEKDLNKILTEKGTKQDKQSVKELFANLTQKLRENPNYVDYGSTALGAGAGGLIGANLFKSEEEGEEDEPSLLGGALGAVGGAGLGYGAGRAINHYLSKKSSDLEQSFERGFVKRAAEHGFSGQEAEELLTKEALALPIGGAIGGGVLGYKFIPKKKDEKLSRKAARGLTTLLGAMLGRKIGAGADALISLPVMKKLEMAEQIEALRYKNGRSIRNILEAFYRENNIPIPWPTEGGSVPRSIPRPIPESEDFLK